VDWVVNAFPKLKNQLRTANIKESPHGFIKKRMQFALVAALGISVLLFFMLSTAGKNLIVIVPGFFIAFILLFVFLTNGPKVIIKKRERDINKEVLFAGRYLLVKLESGTPLFNALIDASSSYGICSKYFREIVDNVNLGIPIEKAIENAREFNASSYFKLVLSELLTTLKTGADVSDSLRIVLKDITTRQLIEIKAYSKKLNAFMMMYLMVATVMPSLGMTILFVVGGFMGLNINFTLILLSLFLLALIQIIFINLIKGIRPAVNL